MFKALSRLKQIIEVMTMALVLYNIWKESQKAERNRARMKKAVDKYHEIGYNGYH